MILAQYTIRSKQEHIFKTNRILEIVGASKNIANAWNVLFEQAENAGLKTLRLGVDNDFSLKTVEKMFQEEVVQMVELFCGGGNETILYDNLDSYRKANQKFTGYLLRVYPGITPMAVCTEVSGDYNMDYRELMNKAEVEKNRMISGQNCFNLPFSMMDKETFQPLTRIDRMDGKSVRYSEESWSKRITGMEVRDRTVKFLDDMITSKGEESLLAIVHADGNNMGSKIMEMLNGKNTYDECVPLMRSFTKTTADAFSIWGKEALYERQKSLMKQYPKLKEKSFAVRELISDGDDMTFICNARFVMEYVNAYVNAVQNYSKIKESEWDYSSCAGICIFHSHYPFARAYSIAEQACDDGAKKKVHVTDENGKPEVIEEGWVDYHYIHSGIGGNLEEIRIRQNTAKCMARPWLLTEGRKTEKMRYQKLLSLNNAFKEQEVSRSNIKTLGATWETSKEDGFKELQRVYGHTKNLKDVLTKLFDNETELMKAIYDLSEVYDLWFYER